MQKLTANRKRFFSFAMKSLTDAMKRHAKAGVVENIGLKQLAREAEITERYALALLRDLEERQLLKTTPVRGAASRYELFL